MAEKDLKGKKKKDKAFSANANESKIESPAFKNKIAMKQIDKSNIISGEVCPMKQVKKRALKEKVKNKKLGKSESKSESESESSATEEEERHWKRERHLVKQKKAKERILDERSKIKQFEGSKSKSKSKLNESDDGKSEAGDESLSGKKRASHDLIKPKETKVKTSSKITKKHSKQYDGKTKKYEESEDENSDALKLKEQKLRRKIIEKIQLRMLEKDQEMQEKDELQKLKILRRKKLEIIELKLKALNEKEKRKGKLKSDSDSDSSDSDDREQKKGKRSKRKMEKKRKKKEGKEAKKDKDSDDSSDEEEKRRKKKKKKEESESSSDEEEEEDRKKKKRKNHKKKHRRHHKVKKTKKKSKKKKDKKEKSESESDDKIGRRNDGDDAKSESDDGKQNVDGAELCHEKRIEHGIIRPTETKLKTISGVTEKKLKQDGKPKNDEEGEEKFIDVSKSKLTNNKKVRKKRRKFSDGEEGVDDVELFTEKRIEHDFMRPNLAKLKAISEINETILEQDGKAKKYEEIEVKPNKCEEFEYEPMKYEEFEDEFSEFSKSKVTVMKAAGKKRRVNRTSASAERESMAADSHTSCNVFKIGDKKKPLASKGDNLLPSEETRPTRAEHEKMRHRDGESEQISHDKSVKREQKGLIWEKNENRKQVCEEENECCAMKDNCSHELEKERETGEKDEHQKLKILLREKLEILGRERQAVKEKEKLERKLKVEQRLREKMVREKEELEKKKEVVADKKQIRRKVVVRGSTNSAYGLRVSKERKRDKSKQGYVVKIVSSKKSYNDSRGNDNDHLEKKKRERSKRFREIKTNTKVLPMVVGFSYFLPHSLRARTRNENGVFDSVETLRPVFTSTLDWDPDCEMKVGNHGSIYLYDKQSFIHGAVAYSNKDVHTSEYKFSKVTGECTLSSAGDLISASKESNNTITITVRRISFPRHLLTGEFNLDYEHEISRFHSYVSSAMKICVITTASDSGIGSFLDILSYKISSDYIEIDHERRLKLPQQDDLINVFTCDSTLIFTPCGSKLFLLSNDYNGLFIVAYAMGKERFGPIRELDNSDWDSYGCDFIYACHRIMGNILFICRWNGVVKALRGDDLHFSPFNGGNVDLKEYLDFKDSFLFLHVDYFDRILFFIYIQKILFVFDYLRKRVVSKYRVSWFHSIHQVKTNWSGEEIFVFTRQRNKSNLHLNILVSDEHNKVQSLKHLAKIALFQLFSLENLTEMDFPYQLKREMKLLC